MSDDKEVVAWKAVFDGPSLGMLQHKDGRIFRIEQLGVRGQPWGAADDNDQLCYSIEEAQSLLIEARTKITELQLDLGRTKPIDAADPDYPNAQGVANTLRNCQEDLLTEARFVLWQAAQIAERDARIKELEARLEVFPDHHYDGIACRDVTIKLLDEKVAKLEADLAAARAQQVPGEMWLAFDVGCIECGEASSVLGVFFTRNEALVASETAQAAQAKDWRGQHSFEVFRLTIPQPDSSYADLPISHPYYTPDRDE